MVFAIMARMRDQAPVAEQSQTETALQRQEAGLAHVAALAFVAARALPGLAFPVAVAGGSAIARATGGLGLRRGLATGAAAVIESVAILGPAKMSAPAGQLATAPVVGSLAARGRSQLTQIAAAALTRIIFNLFGTAFFIFIIAGSIETFTGTYDGTFGRIPGLPKGTTAAFIGTGIGLLVWSAGATWLQVLIYDRARKRWQGERDPMRAIGEEEGDRGAQGADPPTSAGADPSGMPAADSRLDPRAAMLAAAVGFGLLLASTAPPLLGAIAAWLAVASVIAPPSRDVLRTGVPLVAILFVTSLVVNLIGGEAIAQATERASRVGLLVGVATWMRGATGVEGFYEVTRRLLGRLRRSQVALELQQTLDSLAGDRRMGAATRSLAAKVKAVGDQDLWAIIDEILDWIAAEAALFRTGPSPARPQLAYRPIDGAVLVSAALPALALVVG